MNNISFEGFSLNITEGVKSCWNVADGEKIDIACITREICPQLASYYLKMGLFILILYGVISWGSWWFFHIGYKRFECHYFDELNKRIYWDTFIKNKLMKFMALYIAVIVYLQWRG